MRKQSKDALFDGLYGIWTGEQETAKEKLRERNAKLRRKDNGFRLMKHDVRTRPAFHWTEQRERARVASRCCGFVLLRHLKMELSGKAPKLRLSNRRVNEDLGQAQASVLCCGK